jgi:methionine-rich copper-binding protein CopC
MSFFTSRRNLATRILLAFVLACTASTGALFTASAATAHSELEDSSPAVGESVSSLSELTLTFGEEVVPKFSKYTLTDPAGAAVALGEPAYDSTKTTVTIPVTGKLVGGKYTIGYAILSIDGHPVSGKVAFTSTAAGSAVTKPTGASTTIAFTKDSGAPTGTYLTAIILGGGIGILALVAVITLVIRGRKQKRSRLDGK